MYTSNCRQLRHVVMGLDCPLKGFHKTYPEYKQVCLWEEVWGQQCRSNLMKTGAFITNFPEPANCTASHHMHNANINMSLTVHLVFRPCTGRPRDTMQLTASNSATCKIQMWRYKYMYNILMFLKLYSS